MSDDDYDFSITNLTDDYKSLEVSFHSIKDQYAELASSLGFAGDDFFGDPYASHEDIVEYARTLKKHYMESISG